MAPKKAPNTFTQVKSVLEGAFEFFGNYTAKRQEDARDIAKNLGEKPKPKPKRREKRERMKRSRLLYVQTHALGKTDIKEKMPIYNKPMLFVGTSDKNKWNDRVFENIERSEKFIKSAEKFISLNSKIVIDIAGFKGAKLDERVRKLKEMIDMVRIAGTSKGDKTAALEGIADSYGKEFFTGRTGVFNLLAAFERATAYENFTIKEDDYIVLKLGEKSGRTYRVTGLLKKDATVEAVKQRADQPNQKAMSGFEKVQFELMEKIETDMVQIAGDHELLLKHTKRSSTILDGNHNPVVKVFVNNSGEYQIGHGRKKFTSNNPKEVMEKVRKIATDYTMTESMNEAVDWHKDTLKFLTSDKLKSRLPSNIKLTSSVGSKEVIVGNARFKTDIIISVDGQQYYGRIDVANKKLVMSRPIVSVKNNKESIRVFRHYIKVDTNSPQAIVNEFKKLPELVTGSRPELDKVELVD